MEEGAIMQRIFFGLEGGEIRVYRNHSAQHLIGTAHLVDIGLIYHGTDNKTHLGIRPGKRDTYLDLTADELKYIIGLINALESSDNSTY
jgi:hypothetical protein